MPRGHRAIAAAAAIGALLCAAAPASARSLPSPAVTFVTALRQPGGGELRRATTTLVDVPTPLRVDAGAGPDLLATVVLLSTSRATLVVDRLPGASAALPASVEAVARDPTGGSLGRQRIAVGYDARAGGAPRRFRATVLFGVGGDPQHLAVTQTASGALDGLATTASLFDPGAGGARLREERLGVGFAPVPASIRADVTFASPRIDARVTTSAPAAATIDGALSDGDDVSALHAVVDRLPTEVGVSYGEDADGRPTVAYDAVDPIASIRARFEHRTGGRLREAVDAAIDDLPGRLRFALTGASAGMLTASAPVGQIDVAAARNGEPLAVAGSEPGVRAYARGDFASFALRLRGLQEASVDAAGAIAVDATIAAQPFGVAIDANGLRVAGTIADLPAHLSLRADLAAGAIDYDGHGAGIRTIALRARGRFGGGVRRISATVTRLPPAAHVRFTRTRRRPTRFAFAASQPLGTIDVVATSGRAPPRVARDRDVLYLRDVRGSFVVHGRVSGLRRVAFAAPLDGRGPLAVSIRRASRRPIDVDVRTRVARSARDPLVVEGSLSGLPDAMRLRVEGDRGLHAAYDASAPLGAIHLAARGGGLPALARSVRLDVRDLPRRLRIDQARPGRAFTASAQPAVGSLSVAIASRGVPRPVAGSGSGLRIAGSSLAARLRGLRRVVVRTGSPLRLDATLARQRFAVTVDRPGLRLTGTIDRLPSRIGLLVDLPHGLVDYDGHGESIARIALAVAARRALLGRARRVGLTIASFPSGARVHLDRRAGSFAFDASRPLGTVDVSATDGTPLPGSPADRDLVYYRDVPGAYALHARLSGLRRVAYGSSPISVELGRAGGRPVDVDVQTALAGSATPLVLAGRLDGLPRLVHVTLRGEGRALAADYDASDRLRGLHLTARGGPLPASARSARLDIDDLPRSVRIRVPGDGTFAADADGAVGSLGVAVAPAGEARPVAGSGSGLRYVADGPRAGIAVRLRGLRHVALTRQSPLTLEATLARQPLAFTVDLPRAGQRLTGTLADLPRRIGLTFATGGTLVDYDGHGERIDRIAFDARGRRPLFGRARHVFGTIAGFPSGRLQLSRGGATRVQFAASQPIEEVDVTATNGPAAPPAPAGRDLVRYHDAGRSFLAHVRVSGLRRVAFAAPQGGPITAAIARSSARPLDVDVRTVVQRGRRPLVVRGSLAGLPSDLRVGLRTAGGVHATYAASGPLRAISLTASGPPLPARVRLDVRGLPDRLEIDVPDARRPRFSSVASGPVQRIALDVRGRTALFGRARRLHATIDDLPARLRLAPGRGGLVFEASRPIGRVRLAASDGCGPAPPGFADGADGLYYRDLPSRYAVSARRSGLRPLAYSASPLTIGVARP
ncbi:MAG: hypothetical protein QOJ35_3676, partial [Solirubrobacteraceae bacterium]|nr:hypothetical protein [Solirubrobacteraceae bacterium]